MKIALLAALALITVAPVAHAQIVIQAPPIPGIGLGGGPRQYGNDYWRERREGGGEDEWRRRSEYREEEHRRMDWRRAHCVRDYRGEEYCRR